MNRKLLLGITQKNTAHAPVDPPIGVDEMFRRTREAGVFDYFDKTPPEDEVDDYRPSWAAGGSTSWAATRPCWIGTCGWAAPWAPRYTTPK